MSFARSFIRTIQRTTFLWVHGTLFQILSAFSQIYERKNVKQKEKAKFYYMELEFLKQNEQLLKKRHFLFIFRGFRSSLFSKLANFKNTIIAVAVWTGIRSSAKHNHFPSIKYEFLLDAREGQRCVFGTASLNRDGLFFQREKIRKI